MLAEGTRMHVIEFKWIVMLDPSIAKSSSFLACTRLLHYTDVTYGSYISQMHVVLFFSKIQAGLQYL